MSEIIEIPCIQKEWLKNNFGLTKKDCDFEFFNKKYFIDTLEHGCFFREKKFVEYFIDELECGCHSDKVKNKITLLITQLLYLKQQSLKKEFYELFNNIEILLNCFIPIVEYANEVYLQEIVNKNIKDLKINLINTEPPQ
jgi:hypothetical protein